MGGLRLRLNAEPGYHLRERIVTKQQQLYPELETRRKHLVLSLGVSESNARRSRRCRQRPTGYALPKSVQSKGLVFRSVGNQPGSGATQPLLDLRRTSIDKQLNARNKTAVSGRQEQCGARNFVSRANSTKRHH